MVCSLPIVCRDAASKYDLYQCANLAKGLQDSHEDSRHQIVIFNNKSVEIKYETWESDGVVKGCNL